MEVAQVNLPIGLLIWVMIIPMLVKVDFGALHEVRQHVRGIGVTLFVNWLVKPFSMAFLGWLFVRNLFAPIIGLLLGISAITVPWGTLATSIVLCIVIPLVLLFAFQGTAIIGQPLITALLAVPTLIQVFFNSALAYWLNRKVGERHNVACPSALIGASNFFELAVAAAISLFGFESGAALATAVGVLIDVPVMLLVVKVINASKGWYEHDSWLT
jgi:arsenite transporter